MNAEADVVFVPIRHHSPACAFALARALEAIRPAQVLVEAPADFAGLAPALTDPRARPPLAIVSMPAGEGAGGASIYPFCAHSPEYVALCWARAAGARLDLIDLPARHPGMRARWGEAAPASLFGDRRLDHNAYVTELCARRGVRDGAALWDALFEAQAGGDDWRGFFEGVGAYCGHIREVTLPDEMAGDGTLEREAHMVGRLRAALAQPGPIVVVTGGFHTPALRGALQAGGPNPGAASPAKAAPGTPAYLIRYGFQQLDRASGYGAGLPHPAWYDLLWRALGEVGALEGLATGVLVDFADHLRRETPALAMATPTLAAADLAARRLAALRDLPWPGRTELLDAVRSAAVKDAVEAGSTPLLAAFGAFLTGDAIGDLPPGLAQPPIVDSVRAQAAVLGFAVETGGGRDRDLDVQRRPRHALASRFLFALDMLGVGFARRIRGPDLAAGWAMGALIETWRYAWSPMVEQALIQRAADGETLEALCLAEFARRQGDLAARGQSRAALPAAELMVAVARTGQASLIGRAIDGCAMAMAEDPDAASIIRALALISALAAGAETELAAAFGGLRRQGFARLIQLFPHLADTPADRLGDLISALAELAVLAGEDDDAADRGLLGEAVLAALAGAPPPALNGALTAFASLIGALPPEAAAARLAAALDGVYVETGARGAALTGALTVAPRLLMNSPPLLLAADRFLGGIEADAFLQVLPELRLAFGRLNPSEIDQVAEWVARRHGLNPAALVAPALDDAETAENLRFAQSLEARWRADGLAAWMGARP